jgi:hypothetical protein
MYPKNHQDSSMQRIAHITSNGVNKKTECGILDWGDIFNLNFSCSDHRISDTDFPRFRYSFPVLHVIELYVVAGIQRRPPRITCTNSQSCYTSHIHIKYSYFQSPYKHETMKPDCSVFVTYHGLCSSTTLDSSLLW